MKTVKVYDINSRIKAEFDGKYEGYGAADRELAIIEGPKGIVVSDYEAVHWLFGSVEENIALDLYEVKIDASGRKMIPMLPSKRAEATIAYIKEKCEAKEVDLGQWVRRFGARLESNYDTLLKSIKKVGLDSRDYPRHKDADQANRRIVVEGAGGVRHLIPAKEVC